MVSLALPNQFCHICWDGIASHEWTLPPPILKRLLTDLFLAKPDDVLTWIHLAVWHLHTEDSTRVEPSSTVNNGENDSISVSAFQIGRKAQECDLDDFSKFRVFPNGRKIREVDLDDCCKFRESVLHLSHPPLATSLAKWKSGTVSPRGGQGITVSLQEVDLDASESDDNLNATVSPTATRISYEVIPEGEAFESTSSVAVERREDGGRDQFSQVSRVGESQGIRSRQPSNTRTNSTASRTCSDNTAHASNSMRRVVLTSDGTGTLAVSKMSSSRVSSIQSSVNSGMSHMESTRSDGGHTRKQTRSSFSGAASHTLAQVFGAYPNIYSRRQSDSLASCSFMTENWAMRQYGAISALDCKEAHTFRQSYTMWSAKSPRNTVLDMTCSGGVLSPASSTRFIWDLIFLALVIIEIWATPFEVIYVPLDGRPVWISFLGALSIIFFCIDIVLNFFTGVIVDGRVMMEVELVRKHYFKSWFALDTFMAASDLTLFILSAREGGSFWIVQKVMRIVIKVARMARAMLRAKQWVICFTRHKELGFTSRFTLELLNLHVSILLLAHGHAIVWASLMKSGWSCSRDIPEAYHRYLQSFTWAYTALTFGNDSWGTSVEFDILRIAVTAERICLSVIALLWLARRLPDLALKDSKQMHENVLPYLRRRRVPIPLQMQVYQHIEDNCRAQKRKRYCSAVEELALPAMMNFEIHCELWRHKLLSFGLIKQIDEWNALFVPELAQSVHEEVYTPQHILCSAGEASNSAYYVISGTLESTFNMVDKRKANNQYLPGMWLGETALINPDLCRKETIICKTRTELMIVPADAFRMLVAEFQLAELFENCLRKNLWLGICGRCGALGDHVADDCTGSTYGILKVPATKMEIESDLLRFLQIFNIECLAPLMAKHGVVNLETLITSNVDAVLADPLIDSLDVVSADFAEILSEDHINKFKEAIQRTADQIIANSGINNHLIFISHYKLEAGTEATLFQKDFERFIDENPLSLGLALQSPIFVDTEDLRDLTDLESHVRRSHNFVIFLTQNVLSRPWVLIEIVTAVRERVRLVPVELQRVGMKFQYPDEEYYRRLEAGDGLDESARKLLSEKGISLEELAESIKKVFKTIAMPFSPHKTGKIRQAELAEILARCRLRNFTSKSSHNTYDTEKGNSILRNVQHKRIHHASSNLERLANLSVARATGNSR